MDGELESLGRVIIGWLARPGLLPLGARGGHSWSSLGSPGVTGNEAMGDPEMVVMRSEAAVAAGAATRPARHSLVPARHWPAPSGNALPGGQLTPVSQRPCSHNVDVNNGRQVGFLFARAGPFVTRALAPIPRI